jgi:hypothetical protein
MSGRIHLDCFTSLDELKPKQRSDPMAVLEVLRRTKRFSAFDMYDMKLVNSVEALQRMGRIKTDNSCGYPWVNVEIIEPKPRTLTAGQGRFVEGDE